MAAQRGNPGIHTYTFIAVAVIAIIIGALVISQHRFKMRSRDNQQSKNEKRGLVGVRSRLRSRKQVSEAKRARKQAPPTVQAGTQVSDGGSINLYNTAGPRVIRVEQDRGIKELLIGMYPAPPRPDPVAGIEMPAAITDLAAILQRTPDHNAHTDVPSDIVSRSATPKVTADGALGANNRQPAPEPDDNTADTSAVVENLPPRDVEQITSPGDSKEIAQSGLDDSRNEDTGVSGAYTGEPSGSSPHTVNDNPRPVQFRRAGGCDILVLGPVEMTWFPKSVRRRVVPELICYLALHQERNMTGEEIRAALWPGDYGAAEVSAKSLRNAVSLARKAIGHDMVPEAFRGSGYSLASKITTDWARFCELRKRSDEEGANEQELLTEALLLVRGAPFEGVDSGYSWAWNELFVSQMEVAIIAVAHRLASLALSQGDYEQASLATIAGLSASPYDRSLWQDGLMAAKGRGGLELDRMWRDAVAVLGSDASDLTGYVESLRAGNAQPTNQR